ncbi:MAG TPA: DUF177 domain-containing protein [Firmicutes bacterium]|nr:DUF177 domain-containing protein [Bacillota bacterium]
MKINVRDIKKCESLEVSYDIQSEAVKPYVDEAVVITEPVHVKAELRSSDSDVVGRFEVRGELQLSCARCLAPVPYKVETGFWTVFRKSSSVKRDEPGMGDEDVVEFDGDEIDLDDVVLQNVALSIPVKVLCRSDCKGIEWRE